MIPYPLSADNRGLVPSKGMKKRHRNMQCRFDALGNSESHGAAGLSEGGKSGGGLRQSKNCGVAVAGSVGTPEIGILIEHMRCV